MKSINKILILFMLLMSIAVYAIWEFLQSEWVAQKISAFATKYVEELLNADIEFESLQFKLFPPGADLKEFTVEGEKAGYEFKVEVNKLGIYFNPLDIFTTSFNIDEIQLDDGAVRLVPPKVANKVEQKSSENNEAIAPEKIFRLLENIPINQIDLKDFYVTLGNERFKTRSLKVKNKLQYIELNGEISNIETEKISKKLSVDEVGLDLTVNAQNLNIRKLSLKKDLGLVEITGNIVNYISDDVAYKLESNIEIPLMIIGDLVDFSKVGKISQGYTKTQVKVNGEGKAFNAVASVEAENVDSDFAYAEKLNAIVKVNPKQIKFEKFSMQHKRQSLELLKPFEFFNLETKKWVEEPVIVNARQLQTNNFLRFLGDKVDLISGTVSGEIRFVLGEDYYTFFTGEGVVVNQLELKPGGTRIFEIKDLNLDYGNFNIQNNVFTMDLVASDGATSINLKGEISKDKFLLVMPPSNLNFEKISPIVNFNIGGEGKVGFELKRNEEKKMIMTLAGDFKDVNFENYWLDEIKTELVFDFDSNTISIGEFKGKSNNTLISSTGLLNYKTKEIDTKFFVEQLNFTETKRIFRNSLKNIKYTANEIHGKWDIDGRISGKMNKEELKIDGAFQGVNNYFFKESLDTFKFKFVLDEQVFKIKDFIAKKATGTLYSFMEYNIDKSTADVWLKITDLPISEISYYARSPLALQGLVNGSINMKYAQSRWNGGGDLYLKDSAVQSNIYSDSSLRLDVKDSMVNFDLKGFGRQVELGAKINLDDITGSSYAKVNLNIDSIRKMFGVFKGVDVSNTNLEGRVQYSLETEFTLPEFKIKKIQSNLTNLQLNKKPINVDYQNSSPEVIVENGLIKKWDVNVRGRKFYILSKGEGDFNNNYDVTTNTKIDASIVEIFNSIVSKANGNIRGKLIYKSDKGKDEYQALLTSNNLSLNTKLLPTAITKADMRLSFEDSVLRIEKFLAKLISGSFELNGDVDLKRLIPDVNIRFAFKETGLTIMKKSNFVFSGTGSLVGKTFPYTLGGDFYIQKFNLINELADFGGDSAITSSNDIKYLPGTKRKIVDNVLDLNVNIITREPMYITNSIADLGFLGNIQVTGGEKDPRLAGKISLAPRKNRVTFKNNEFTFSKGNIFFSERSEYKNPELDFLAQSNIGDYKVNVKVLGPVKNFDMSLYSEPALPQSDILSLIAFGYTEDLSNSLSDQDKESMTRASIGSLLFDSFKINETLKNEFGIQVNLGTDITEEERSFLSQRNAEGNGDNRVRSATTFQIKKQLSDAMSLSVSSTVGTNSSQRQSVNLNYNVDKKVSVEGVYESRQTDETETINNDTSFGADIKMRWSFK